ncbi:nascent polypeptide-associated complex protein [Halalkalicoccus subterraneus]|uniref:nascent polypeptide-associated complex protein n=1 Tax=Halalkalicoccus subterraneus TaxID=2675002 RepID=UPI000EFB6E28|nr:nascent polypeptide-associated complex protein [Halalkalicoccus subterraneus]
MFGGGGGGLDPRKMEQMMKQMGIDTEELDAEEIVIRTGDGEELVFTDAEVTVIQAQGQETYQIVGEPETREAGSGSSSSSDAGEDAAIEDADIPADDIEIVAMRTGASEDDAREALEEADGDLANAVETLEAEPK